SGKEVAGSLESPAAHIRRSENPRHSGGPRWWALALAERQCGIVGGAERPHRADGAERDRPQHMPSREHMARRDQITAAGTLAVLQDLDDIFGLHGSI